MSNQVAGSNDLEGIVARIAKLPEEQQFLVETCIENILKGSHWGFLNKEHLKMFPDPMKFNNNVTSVYQVKSEGGKPVYLVETTDVKSALKLLSKVAPTLVDQDFINMYLAKLKDAQKNFELFLSKIRKDGTFKGYIGSNSVNGTATMTFRRDRHKAFQLPLATVITELVSYFGSNAYIYVKGELISFQQLPQYCRNLHEIYNELTVSEGHTSVVLPIMLKVQ